jgi:hypothetical protein
MKGLGTRFENTCHLSRRALDVRYVLEERAGDQQINFAVGKWDVAGDVSYACLMCCGVRGEFIGGDVDGNHLDVTADAEAIGERAGAATADVGDNPTFGQRGECAFDIAVVAQIQGCVPTPIETRGQTPVCMEEAVEGRHCSELDVRQAESMARGRFRDPVMRRRLRIVRAHERVRESCRPTTPLPCVPSYFPGEGVVMPLCFIEPQDAIRVIAESVGREARRQLLGELVRAWVDEIPENELASHYAKAVQDLDEHDLSMLAAWHASLEVGHPIANREFLVNVFPSLGENRREALKIAAGFRGEEAFDAGVAEDQALQTVLPHLSRTRCMELATECVELYLWDRLGSDN